MTEMWSLLSVVTFHFHTIKSMNFSFIFSSEKYISLAHLCKFWPLRYGFYQKLYHAKRLLFFFSTPTLKLYEIGLL